jgi:hypothetical protein
LFLKDLFISLILFLKHFVAYGPSSHTGKLSMISANISVIWELKEPRQVAGLRADP